MKKILTLSLVCFLAITTKAQELSTNEYENKISLSAYYLKGKVEQVKTTATDRFGKSITLPFLENELYNEIVLTFDTKGNLTKRNNLLDYRGKLGIYNFIEYDYEQNNRLKQQKTTVVNNGEDPLRVASLKQYQYDSKGTLITLNEVVKNKTSTLSYQTDFKYDPKLKEITTKVDGSILSKKQLFYNKKGKLNKEETTSFDGKKGLNKFYIYDQETLVYSEEEINNRRQIQYFDQENGKSKYQQFDHNQNLKLELIYNNNQQVIEAKVQTYQNGKPLYRSYQLTYELDSVGNWTKATITTGNEVAYYLNRTITYY